MGEQFGGGMGGEFDTVGANGGDSFTKIECGRCGTIMGVVSGRVHGPAYCGECWTRIREDGAERAAAAAAAAGCAGSEDESAASTGAKAGMGEEAGEESADREPAANGGGNGGGEGGSGLALRLRTIMRSLHDEHGGEAPTRKEVLETMAVDGGDGAWRTTDEAAHCLDNALCGIVYEPVEGRLALIDGE